MISLQQVQKQFGELWAVRELNLEIPRGELFAFLGPNGAGKTTTIKLMCGLLRPTAGVVSVAGYNVQTHPLEARRRIGYIPDQPYLYEKLTGREFLYFVGKLYDLEPRLVEERIGYYLELFSLEVAAGKLIEDYSHGMRQKLVFSAALLHTPEVLIIDEPMVGLDPKSVRLVKDLMREQTHNGVTIFLSTHTLSVAEELAHRIGVIDHGQMRFCGTLEEMRRTRSGSQSLEEWFLELTRDEEE